MIDQDKGLRLSNGLCNLFTSTTSRPLVSVITQMCKIFYPSDCRRVIYQHRLSAQKFRPCDEKNLGMSEFCNLENPGAMTKPQIWGQQVYNEYQQRCSTPPAFLADIESNERTLESLTQIDVFKTIDRAYNAFDQDIAMLSVFFDTPTVLQFGTQSRQGWIDFFSNVGGLLGLCIGMSIVTLIELLWLCSRLMGLYFKQRAYKKERKHKVIDTKLDKPWEDPKADE